MRSPDRRHTQDFGCGRHARSALLRAILHHGGHASRDRARIDRCRIRVRGDERANVRRHFEELEHPDATAIAGASATLAAARLMHGLARREAKRHITWLCRNVGWCEGLADLAAVTELAHQALRN